MSARNTAVPAVYLILRRGDEILLMRRKGSGYYDGWYSIPAGHVEAGELPVDSLRREAHEELGLELEREHVRLVHTMYRTKHDETGDRADYFFVATTWRGEPKIHEPEKCDDVRWFRITALPEQLMHHVREALRDVHHGISYSELGSDRVVRNPTKTNPGIRE